MITEENKFLGLEEIKNLIEKELFGQFNIFISSHEEQKANYDKCIAHLEILAGEKHDN